MPDHIPILAAQDVAKAYGCRQVIILAWDGSLTHVVTYGESVLDSAQAAKGGNDIKRNMGWPEEQCQAVSAKVEFLQNRVNELETLVESVSRGAATTEASLIDGFNERIRDLEAERDRLQRALNTPPDAIAAEWSAQHRGFGDGDGRRHGEDVEASEEAS